MLKDCKNLKILISEKQDGNMRLGFGNENLENRRRFLNKNKVEKHELVSAKLANGNNIKVVEKEDGGKIIENTDGLITNQKNIFLAITVADCLPIFLYNPREKVIGLLHTGWRGLNKKIIEKGLDIFKENFDSRSNDIKIAIGLGICQDCYEIGRELGRKFEDYSEAIIEKHSRMFLDLKKAAELKLIQKGIKKENIEISKECTSCLREKYFSFRRDKPKKTEAMIVVFGRVN